MHEKATKSSSRPVLLALVLVLAACLRIVHFIHIRDAVVLEPWGVLDDAFYFRLGIEAASGNLLLGSHPFFLSPLYIYFLGVFYALFVPGLEAPFIAQIFLGVASVLLAYKCGRMIRGPAAGLLAALLLSLDGLCAMYSCTLMPASLDVFLCGLFAYFLLRAVTTRTWHAWLICGATCGLFALNRPNALLLLPFCAIVPLRQGGLKAYKHGLVCAAAALVVIAPATARNYMASKELVLISSHGGLNFYIGNHAGADGFYSPPAWLDPTVQGQAEGARAYLESEMGRPVRDAEVSKLLYDMTFREIRSDVPAWLLLMVKKTLYMINAREAGLNYSIGYMRRELSPVLWLMPVGFWVLLPLAAAGALAGRKRFEVRVLVLLVLIYAAAVVMFFISDRYRLPLHFPLAVLSGMGVGGLYSSLRTRQTREALVQTGGLVFVLVLSSLDLGVPSGAGQMRLDHALKLIERGRADEARELAARMPAGAMNPFVWRWRLARAYGAMKNYDYSEEQYRALIEILPDSGELRCELGELYLAAGIKLGPDDACRKAYERALETSGE